MIDTRKIPQERPSEKQIALNKWQMNEMRLMGFLVPYDSGGGSSGSYKIELTQFESWDEYNDAIKKAFILLTDFKPVPEPLRTKLILEAENLRNYGVESCLLV